MIPQSLTTTTSSRYKRVSGDDQDELREPVDALPKANSYGDWVTGKSHFDCGEGIISLEHDCYSISIVHGIPAAAAICLPVISAVGQIMLLYFVAFLNENMFDEGHWLEPTSAHVNVKIMKVIGILIALFKVSTELQNGQQLFRALMVGELDSPRRRLFGWWSLMMQYCMVVLVLFVATSVVLAGQTCAFIMGKIFAVFVVVDMDNLLARFLEVVWSLTFHIKVDTELAQTWRHRERMVGSFTLRLCFVLLPTIMILFEIAFSLMYNTPPLTYLRHGAVSNHMAPDMLVDFVPPTLLTSADSSTQMGSELYTYSLLVLSPPGSLAPALYWVVLEATAEPRAPSSLQVREGRDGDGNTAMLKGSVQTHRAQVGSYLQRNGFTDKKFSELQRVKMLYRLWMPYEATFNISGLRHGAAYLVYMVAQNPETLALAKTPTRAATLLTSFCADRCESCAFSGSGRCDVCQSGSHKTLVGLCLPCPEHCAQCVQSAELFDFSGRRAATMADEIVQEEEHNRVGRVLRTMPCDVGGCDAGYGLTAEGECKPCSIVNCLACDGDPSTCKECTLGHGLDSNGTCAPCSHARCICINAGDCDLCQTGFGFSVNGTCEECQEGCSMCEFAHHGLCESCMLGFASNGFGCTRCMPHCMRCNASGAMGCDSCQTNYGYDAIVAKCKLCTAPHCSECNGANPDFCTQCSYGYGVSVDGFCESCGVNCKECNSVGKCEQCHQYYTLVNGECKICGDRCSSCLKAGPGKCDECLPGFVLENKTSTCLPHGLEM